MERNGSVSLRPWTMEDKEDLARLCNGVDRSYLRNSLPFPYTEKGRRMVDRNDPGP